MAQSEIPKLIGLGFRVKQEVNIGLWGGVCFNIRGRRLERRGVGSVSWSLRESPKFAKLL